MNPNPSFIRIVGLQRRYEMGGTIVRALDGVDIDIAERTFTVVMGPSGSGKSSLLYLLGGLDRPTAGEIYVNGERLDQMDENALARFRRKTMGFIFQSFNLISSMTALENVAFPMQFSGTPAARRNERAKELLAQVGLADRAQHKPSELSGGQQQRVAVARALVNDPALVFADEPTGNLDTQSGVTIMQMLADLHKSGRTVLVVTHDPRMVRFATNKIFLLDGKAVSEAEYQAVALEPLQANFGG
ncbi:MAG: ABC transporter ATP-binding protein [Anaerolineales bacterium]|nr:ABC transporter ATP-binding protein [Anaerolineales bacterium]